ncbi:MAG TPA: glycoside hydrolase family 9 protein [Polyangiaceae bacterium]|nr:glycoside hydrolase family 9 protein [Polyangiaceae bacterium]
MTLGRPSRKAARKARAKHAQSKQAASFTPAQRALTWLAPATLGLACAGAGARVHVNQVGYERRAPKHAVIESEHALAGFRVVSTLDSRVLLDQPMAAQPPADGWDSGRFVYRADFSQVQEPGEYVIEAGTQRSIRFRIGEQLLFATTAPDVLAYFRHMRADAPEIWAADAQVPILESNEKRDVRGGWYDASGDVSKYLSHLSYANFLNPQQTPLVVWILGWTSQQAHGLLQRYGLQQAAAEEAAWGADFLLRMQDESGFFFATVFDGWSGDPSARKLCAYSGIQGSLNTNYRAALREGGGLAIAALARAARGRAGAFPTDAYLQAAVKGFAHLKQHNLEYVDDQTENVIDDYSGLLAATELFVSTSQTDYLEAARERAARLIRRLHPTGYFVADARERPFYHASDAGLPIVALTEYTKIEPDVTRIDETLSGIARHLNYWVSVTREVPNPFGYARQHVAPGKTSFFIPHDNESGYWWQGENARLASLSAATWLGQRALARRPPSASKAGADAVSPPALESFATDQLAWILGHNPVDVCMLQGFGANNPPPYSEQKRLGGTLRGGIANGITSRERDEQGFQWSKAVGPGREWERWRWLEQWLPHAAWYFMAITLAAQSEPLVSPGAQP